MKAAVIAHWNGPKPGREREAYALKRETDDLFDTLIADGVLDDAAWFFGTDGPSYFIVRGDATALRELEDMPQNLMLMAKSRHVNDGFGYALYATGAAADAIHGLREHVAKELHLT
jgi:hypothetical protein